jgi:hypothetical protein
MPQMLADTIGPKYQIETVHLGGKAGRIGGAENQA